MLTLFLVVPLQFHVEAESEGGVLQLIRDSEVWLIHLWETQGLTLQELLST